MVSCTTPDQCPGEDNECGTRTCNGGMCGIDAAPDGTEVENQTDNDCVKSVCDGHGIIVGVPDNSDLPDDGNDCTSDTCAGGIPDNENRPLHATCDSDGGSFCTSDGVCVECTQASDCASNNCTNIFTCATAQCDDNIKNGNETAPDCGGGTCDACATGLACEVDLDCVSLSCGGSPLECQESCTDGIQNQDESDEDCGGDTCDPCVLGQNCDVGSDCETGACNGLGVCSCTPQPGAVIISEVRTRGLGAGNDEMIELFNPGTSPITLGSAWVVQWRPQGGASYTTKFTGANQVVPAGGHLLITGTAYAGPPASDVQILSSGISDAGSLIVKNGTTTVDAVCFRCSAGDSFTGLECEGTPIMKTTCSNNVDKSIERKPGGTMGNCIDTSDTASDFAEISPSKPQNLASPPTP